MSKTLDIEAAIAPLRVLFLMATPRETPSSGEPRSSNLVVDPRAIAVHWRASS